jgi:hypothetical protein
MPFLYIAESHSLQNKQKIMRFDELKRERERERERDYMKKWSRGV